MEAATEVRDYHALVSDEIVDTKYIPESGLKNFDPGDKWIRHVIEYPPVGLQSHEGVILTIEGTRRVSLQTGGNAQVHLTDGGQEISESEANKREQAIGRHLPRVLAWDWRVVDVEVTDGPEQHSLLMESHEQAKKRQREEFEKRADADNNLGEAIQALTKTLQGSNGEEPKAGKVTEEEALEVVLKQFTPDQLAEMADTKRTRKKK